MVRTSTCLWWVIGQSAQAEQGTLIQPSYGQMHSQAVAPETFIRWKDNSHLVQVQYKAKTGVST